MVAIMDKKRKILSDHRKRGKILIPPFVDALKPIKEVSWVKTIMPEILWIGLIQFQHGHRDGIKLITSMARMARSIHLCDNEIFAATSNYFDLSEVEWSEFREKMAASGDLFYIQESLESLISLYPECPLTPVFSSYPIIESNKALSKMKETVFSLYDRFERDAMMVQATAVWLAFDSGTLKVNEGLALSHFPEIEHYPDTDISRKIGSSIRSTINMILGDIEITSWPNYFWNRGLSISPCEFNNG